MNSIPDMDTTSMTPLARVARGIRAVWRLTRAHGAVLGLAAIMGLYAYLQVRNWIPGYGEADLDGYVFLAKRLAHFQSPAVTPPTPFDYHEHLWVETSDGRITAKFSPGMPLLMALFYRLFGDNGVYLVSPLAGLATLAGAFVLFRHWMSAGASLIAILAMSLNMVFLVYSGYPLAHSASTASVTWGMVALWKWMGQPTLKLGIAAGLLLGFAIAVRHTNALLCGCIAVSAVSVLRSPTLPARERWRAILGLAAAYTVFPLLLMVWNTVLFGGPFTTGYSLSNEQGAFSLVVLRGNYTDVISRAYGHFLFELLPFGLMGILVLGTGRERAIRLLWLAPLSVIYASYYWYQPYYGFFRFLMPVVPLMAGMAFALIDRAHASRCGRYAGMIALLALGIWHATHHYGINLGAAFKGRLFIAGRPAATMNRALRSVLDDDAVIFSKDRYVYCVGMRRNYRLHNLTTFTKAYGQAAFPERRDYTLSDLKRGAIPPRRQEQRASWLREFYHSQDQADLDAMKRDLVREAIEAGRQVVFLLPDGDARRELNSLGGEFRFEPLKTIPDDRPAAAVRGPRPDWHVHAVAITSRADD